MSKRNKKPLFRLIKSLSKAEKRHFRLYANRTMSDRERKFLVLFDLLDKQEAYDREKLLTKLPGSTTAGQLANLKRHLFRELLTSLRLTHIDKLIDIEIREQLDFARILYSKGLYLESLRLLERVRKVAKDHDQQILHLQILEFQKLIESRHITRSRQVEKKMDRLLEDSNQSSRATRAISEAVNQYIQIHGHYIVYGFATTAAQLDHLEQAWSSMQSNQQAGDLKPTFFENINNFQSNFWYRYIRLDFPAALHHAHKSVNIFGKYPHMKYKDPDLYLRSLYYLLVFLYLTEDRPQYERYLAVLDEYVVSMDDRLNLNSQHVRFVYQHLSRLNYYFLTKAYKKALTFSQSIIRKLADHRVLMDDHRYLLFYYKFAAAAFGAGDHEQALAYLHPILHQGALPLHKNMEINARLLELLCLYETAELDRMEYRLTSFGRGIPKSKKATPLQLTTFYMLRHLLKHYTIDQQPYLQEQLAFFQTQREQPRERLFLKYLNVIEWITTKIPSEKGLLKILTKL